MLKCFKSLRALALVIVCVPFVLLSYYTLYGITATNTKQGTEDYLISFFDPSQSVTETKNAVIPKINVTEQQKQRQQEPIPSILDPMHQFDKNGPWASSTTIPKWMKDYFIWHREKRRKGLTFSDKSNKYLIVTCRESDRKCGGLSDRLKPVPLYLLMASMTQRILLFHWNTPCALEEYLVPPEGGLDWRIPETLRDLKILQERDLTNSITNVEMAEDFMDGPTNKNNEKSSKAHGLNGKRLENVQVVTTKIQHHDAGHETFNRWHGLDVTHFRTGIFADLYHEVFRLLFEPTPPMALRISKTMDLLGLVPGHYTAAHVRARYPANQGPLGLRQTRQTVSEATTVDKAGNWPFHKFKKMAIEVATNAINCAYWLNPGAPIYFASDSHDTVKYIVEDSPFANNAMGFPVVGVVTTVEPLHLDMPASQNHACTDFYSAFEESWILGQSTCMSFGMGGYGRFGSMLSYNHSCNANHRNYKGHPQKCPPAVNIQASMDTALHSTSNATSFRRLSKPKPINSQSSLNDRVVRSIIDPAASLNRSGPWESSSTIPNWMKDYFAWHKEQRQGEFKRDGNNNKYLIISCLDAVQHCGGLADRFKPLPLYVMIASLTRRVLLIHWDSPCALKEYLVPPEGGFDWRVPKELERLLPESQYERLSDADAVEAFINDNITNNNQILQILVQYWTGGKILFNQWNGFTDETKGGPFHDLFSDMFRLMFEPSPPLALRIQDTMAKFGLQPGNYTGAHARIRYPAMNGPLGIRKTGRTNHDVNMQDKNGNFPFHTFEQQAVDIATNAVNCAYGINPGAPIYFTSDSHDTVKYMLEKSPFAHSSGGFPVVGSVASTEPLHLAFSDHKDKTCSDFYQTFEDFTILSQSSCISYGMGSFGRLASLISHNETCQINHRNFGGKIQQCSPPNKLSMKASNSVVESSEVVANHEDAMSNNMFNKCSEEDCEIQSILDPSKEYDASGPWEASKTMPQWMKDYFVWHRSERQTNLTLDENKKYLVVSCLDYFRKCGGLSDRLQPLPLYILMASATKRILLIHWTTPCMLEEFLEPPEGGFDWRVPDGLKEAIPGNHIAHLSNSAAIEKFMEGRLPRSDKEQIVLSYLQFSDGGRILFNKKNGEKDESKGGLFNDVFHDMFRVMFQPSPTVAIRIENTMAKLGLVPGQFTAAHMRARYPAGAGPLGVSKIGETKKQLSSYDKEGNWPFQKLKKEAAQIATNAINCAYELNPGAPVYFASDSHEMVQYIIEESLFANSSMGFPVVGVLSTTEPLHLDTPNRENTTCRDYYAAFEESWIMGLSSCASYGMGGYGRFANLISSNVTCNNRHRLHTGRTGGCKPVKKMKT